VVGLVKVDLNQLAESTTVVVAQRLGIAECFQDGVGLQGGKREGCRQRHAWVVAEQQGR
jgi:hypothetical protein